MLKRPLEPYCKHHLHILSIEHSHHISSHRNNSTILASHSLCNFTVFVHLLINKKCALLYLCVYYNIHIYFMVIYLPSVLSQNSMD
jgi:hypothetical protein